MKALEVHFINHGQRHTWLRWYDCALQAAVNHNTAAVLSQYPDARAIQITSHEHTPNERGICELCGDQVIPQ